MYRLTDKETRTLEFGRYFNFEVMGELEKAMQDALRFAKGDCSDALDITIDDAIDGYILETDEGYINLYYYKGGIMATQEWDDVDIARIEIETGKVTTF